MSGPRCTNRRSIARNLTQHGIRESIQIFTKYLKSVHDSIYISPDSGIVGARFPRPTGWATQLLCRERGSAFHFLLRFRHYVLFSIFSVHEEQRNLRFYLNPQRRKHDTNKIILSTNILPRGNSPLALHKIPFDADFWVPTLGIL